MLKFEDIEVGDTVIIRRRTKFHKDTEITGEVRDVFKGPWSLSVYIHGISEAFFEEFPTNLLSIEKKPVQPPKVGHPIKMWNRLMEDRTTCYGFWDGINYSGTNFLDGEISTFKWYEGSLIYKNIRWEYIDETD